MAERRMFAKTIIDSDEFLDMPMSARLLYFDLSMRADDDGFVNNPKRISKLTGASEDDLRVLLAKRFIFAFESGVVVIRHWRIHNYIQNDRYKATIYQEEKNLLEIDGTKKYVLKPLDTECIQDVSKVDTQSSLGESSLGEVRLGESSLGGNGRTDRLSLPTEKEISDYIKSQGYKIDPHRFMTYHQQREFPKDWRKVVDKWATHDYDQRKNPRKVADCMERDEICIEGFGTEYLRERSNS